jgi:osmoprotectant transport system ATP-binding protein
VTQTNTPIVEFKDVSLHLGNAQPILTGLSFDVRSAEILVLLGRSGSGKTTTLKLINRLLLPSAGQVCVEGRATTDQDPVRLRRRIGYVIQEIGLFPHFTVAENIAVVPTLEGWDRERKRERSAELLELVGLEAEVFARRYPSELSGGQRQRVGLARALAADPPLLLLDEPFGALDPLTRLELQRELRQLQARLAKTMVFVTHDVREGLFLASRIALLHDGRLAFIGTPAEFVQSDRPECRAFVEALAETEVRGDPKAGDAR